MAAIALCLLLVTASTRTFPFTILPHSQRCSSLSSENGDRAIWANIFPSFGQRYSYIISDQGPRVGDQ
jgi:hypothetical protein